MDTSLDRQCSKIKLAQNEIQLRKSRVNRRAFLKKKMFPNLMCGPVFRVSQ